jgi:putative endopeptidase
MARPQLTRVQRRDPNATYHKMSVAEAQKLTPGLDWQAFFAAQGAGRFDSVNVSQPEYFKAIDALLAGEPVDAWKAYLRAHALRNAAPALSAAFVDADFAFNRNFSGAKELRPRWQRCVQATDQALGEVLGEEYVKRAFPPESKARMQELVNNLQVVLREKIQGNTWMNDSTKQQALLKLNAFGKKIGYPEKWKTYAGLEVRDDSYYANRRRVADWNRADNWGRLTKPIDKTEWGMTPPTVNAYYSPLFNEIAFPAGILQPPFFFAQADDAVNYGAIGAVIGHEMTHGFDDQGRQFDARGNLRDWWTAADAAKYKGQADKVVAQFSSYSVVDSVTKVNGNLTLGENIADLGGLKIAYDAMQRAYAGKPKTPIDGFTPEQRFFLAYAQVWRQIARDEYLRNQVVTDPHSPAVWRVNGPLSNLAEFQQAFGCKAGDPMVRPAAQRAEIW